MTEEQTDKTFLVFADKQCTLATKATHYEDDGCNLKFFNEDGIHHAYISNYNTKEHIYTIVEGVIAKGSKFTNSIGSMKPIDAGSISCKLDIKINHDKLHSVLKSFDADIKAGLVSEEEILEQLRMDIHEFVDVEMVK